MTALDEFVAALAESLEQSSFVKLTLGKGRRDGLRQAFVRLVEIRGEPHVSISLRRANKDVTENHRVADAAATIRGFLESSFGNAHLFTTLADIELLTNKRGEARLTRHKPTFVEQLATTHDRPKRYVLDPAEAPYLQELGIVSAEGKVRNDKADKYRQLQNLLKIFDDLAAKSRLHERPSLRVVDMGCGKGYLTFALYDYCNNRLGVPTEVIGVDHNPELMQICASVAAKFGFERLRFECTDVAAPKHGPIDVLVALHACDTATDDAIFRGIEAGASIIMTVPCCQKELRPQFKAPRDEQPLFKHDTYKDRFSQMLTDAMRGLLMESQGYRTRISEFISDAHTHRNVMIAGVFDPASHERDAKRDEVAAMKQRYRVDHQRLETLLLTSGRLDAR